MLAESFSDNRHFYPRSPCGERLMLAESFSDNRHFYPRSPCGERPGNAETAITPLRFLSTLSLRRATLRVLPYFALGRYFYPRSPCGERPSNTRSQPSKPNFYPRSPCGERLDDILAGVNELLISIHALLAESDWLEVFLYYQDNNFYPRSPCGERPTHKILRAKLSPISIHALLAESDAMQIIIVVVHALFLSTLSLRRATHLFASSGVDFSISIHALLAESDNTSIAGRTTSNDFYPRSPCGERPSCSLRYWSRAIISIHALLAESDHGLYSLVTIIPSFLSTLSLRRATQKAMNMPRYAVHFYPRSPCGERP